MISNFKYLDIDSINNIVNIVSSKKYAFFDMDGTILDSEKLHFQIIRDLCNDELKYTIDDLYGLPDSDVFPLIKEVVNVNSVEGFLDKKNALFIKAVEETTKNFLTNSLIDTLLQEIEKKGIQLALVTASEYGPTHSLLEKCDFKKYFKTIITVNEVKNTKPNPEPYELAKAFFNAKNEDCIIFEDSPTGIEAAKSANIEYVKIEWFSGE